jgi:hypothetical protein
MFSLQQLKKVNPAFTVRAFKPGKLFIADVGAISVLTVMPGTSIINVDILRYL